MMFELILVGALVVLAVLLAVLYGKYQGVKSEKEVLEEIVKVKDKTIENYKAAKGHIVESEDEAVLKYAAEGMDIDEIARKLDMPSSKVEMILRFAELKAKKED